jgi:hypothetical protein
MISPLGRIASTIDVVVIKFAKHFKSLFDGDCVYRGSGTWIGGTMGGKNSVKL